jgi:ABC-2 type transport system ATP-binding protein
LAQTQPAVGFSNLTKTYRGGRGVRDLTFEVEPGEIFGFLGPNGAGKTTSMRVVMGLLRPTAGSVTVFGLDSWSQSPAAKQRIGFVPGELHLYEHLSGRDLLEFLAAFRSGNPMKRARDLARKYDLDLRQGIKHLSKGNRQKLVVIAAVMHDPDLLVLDEPTSGLDPLMQTRVLDLFMEERRRGKTIFLSSHTLPEVEKVADRVAILRDGELVAVEEVHRLRTLRRRRMEVTFGQPVKPEQLAGLDGVEVMEQSPEWRSVTLAVSGDLKPLLARLAALPVSDIVYPPADLESVFLHYYQDASAEAAGS